MSPWVRLRIAGTRSCVVRAREALGVADHVTGADAVARLQPAGERERRGELRGAADDVGVGDPDVLDPDRGLVEPDRVAAAPLERDELVDRAVAVDQEVRADAGPLAELDVRRVGRERVEGGAVARGRRVVLDDHVRVDQLRLAVAVVAGASSGASGACGRSRTGSGPTRSAASAASAPPARGSAASASTARAWRARRGRRARPDGSSTTNAVEPGSVVLSQAVAVPGSAVEPARGQADAARVGARQRPVAGAGQVDERERLVVGERERGPLAPDEPLQRARLGLGRGPAAGEVRVERPPAGAPVAREVAVEVDAARVLARAGGDPVGVRGADEQQPDARGRRRRAQPRDHRVPGGLVAVDRADHEHRGRRGRVADALDGQRAVARGGAVALRVRGGGQQQDGQDGGEDGAHRAPRLAGAATAAGAP